MTDQGIMGFVERMVEDEGLRDAVAAATEGKEGSEASTAVADLGLEYGFHFSAGEAAQVRAMVMAHVGASEELTEDELEAVAGGGFFGKVGRLIDRALSKLGRGFLHLFRGW